MTGDFSPEVKSDNRDPRVAVALLLDTSGSMDGERIRALNEGFRVFCEEIAEDPYARKRTEVTVVTFGGNAQVAIPFQEGRDLTPTAFTANGGTPMGAALNIAVDQLTARKQQYKDAGLEYYRPWLFLITDGAPTDQIDAARQRVLEMEASKGVSVFAIGVEGADVATLGTLSAKRQPLMLSGTKFRELFQWLSSSLSTVSSSGTFGASDSQVAASEAAEQTPLPSPQGWATW